MILRIAAGVWLSIITLAASYGATRFMAARAASAHSVEPTPRQALHALKPVTIPLIADGQVRTYIVARLSYVADQEELRRLSIPPDGFIQDEAIRMLYADERLTFKKLERVDLSGFLRDLRTRVAQRLKSEVVREIVVEEFNYVEPAPTRN